MILPWRWDWPVLFVGKLYLSVERFFCFVKEQAKGKIKSDQLSGVCFVFIICRWVGDK